jgi:hypothetical protein
MEKSRERLGQIIVKFRVQVVVELFFVFESVLVLIGVDVAEDQIFLELSSIYPIIVQLGNSSFTKTRPFVNVILAYIQSVFVTWLRFQTHKKVPYMLSANQCKRSWEKMQFFMIFRHPYFLKLRVLPSKEKLQIKHHIDTRFKMIEFSWKLSSKIHTMR